ncbi:MAG: hypothetical protein ACYSTT_24690, partial [Planctomycetota bacterium]
MMSLRTRIATLHVALLLTVGCQQATQPVTITQYGTAKTVIVLAADATEPEQHAANELAVFLQQITGDKFEVKAPSATSQSRLLVGPRAAKLAAPDFSTDGLGSDGIVLRTVG